MAEIILPTEKRKVVSIDPSSLMIYSVYKAGKTSISAALTNSLLLELEHGGADKVEANVLDIKSPIQFEETLLEIQKQGCPYDYLIIDTCTRLDEWSEMVGTFNYMDKSQGVRFNRDKTGNRIPYGDKRFETVHSLSNGAGYAFSREVMERWYNMAIKSAKHVIFLAHIKDKFIESKKSGDTVEAFDINLTGKVRAMYCSRVDGVAYLYRKDNKAYLNFDNENSVTCGSRSKHLNGHIEISERMDDGTIITHWDRIFTQEKFD